MKLIELKLEYFSQFVDMAKDYIKVGDLRYSKYIEKESFSEYLLELESMESDNTIKSDLVPSISYWLINNTNKIIG